MFFLLLLLLRLYSYICFYFCFDFVSVCVKSNHNKMKNTELKQKKNSNNNENRPKYSTCSLQHAVNACIGIYIMLYFAINLNLLHSNINETLAIEKSFIKRTYISRYYKYLYLRLYFVLPFRHTEGNTNIITHEFKRKIEWLGESERGRREKRVEKGKAKKGTNERSKLIKEWAHSYLCNARNTERYMCL